MRIPLVIMLSAIILLFCCSCDVQPFDTPTNEPGSAEIGSPDIESSDIERIISPVGIGRENITASLHLMGRYLLNQQQEDGSLTYLTIPGEANKSHGNNMIRQFMATDALGALHGFTGEEVYREAYLKNVEFNFRSYYQIHDGYGFILYEKTVKLGSAAIALSSLKWGAGEDYEENEDQLISFILMMQRDDGSFRTFYLPEGVDRNQNFYPGEAMLSLMEKYRDERNISYLESTDKAFYHYRDFFREEPNPAFVPWQTMALSMLYEETGREEIRDFIYEMNDFLLGIQEHSCEGGMGYLGRFYDPERPQYGPPHASSTAVYVEGLTYAFEIAREEGDEERMREYRNAIFLGARSIMQLQSTMENPGPIPEEYASDMLGGIRKTLESPEFRIDNTQHSAKAFMRILEVMDDQDFEEFRRDYIPCTQLER